MSIEKETNDPQEYEVLDYETLLKYREGIVEHDIPVMRKNKSGIWKLLPVDKLQVYFGKKGADKDAPSLYIKKGWRRIINDDEGFVGIEDADEPEESTDDSFFNVYENEIRQKVERFLQMNNEQKSGLLRDSGHVLNNIAKKVKLSDEDVHNVFEISSDTGIISALSLTQSYSKFKNGQLNGDEIKGYNQVVSSAVTEVVKEVGGVLNSHKESLKYFERLKDYLFTDVYAHSNRVFLLYIDLLHFYNRFADMGKLNTIRARFKKYYLPFYQKIMPGKEDIESLEHVFEKGLSRIDEKSLLYYSIGALLHDIGSTDLDSYDIDLKTQYERLKKHVFKGYHIIAMSTRYPLEVAMLCGYHHEYYGSPSGYGVYRDILKLYRFHPEHDPLSYAVSSDVKSVEQCRSLSFFPVKMLELVDVFDTIRVFSMNELNVDSPDVIEILREMRMDYIDKGVKLDPVLFDIFIDYLSESHDKDYSEVKIY